MLIFYRCQWHRYGRHDHHHHHHHRRRCHDRILIAMPNTNRTATPASDKSDEVTVDQRRQQAAELKTLSPDKVASAASEQVPRPPPPLQESVRRESYLSLHVVFFCAHHRTKS